MFMSEKYLFVLERNFVRKENTHYSLIASLVPTPVEELLNEIFCRISI